MTWRRRLVAGGIVLVVVLVLLPVAVGLAVELATRRALVRWASEAVGAEVRIDAVDVSPLRPQLELRGVVVENPPGFEARPALSLERVAIAVDPASLVGPVVTLGEIDAEGFVLRYSRAGDAANLDTIQANVVAFLERRGLAEEPRVRVARVRARGGQASAPVLVGRATVPLEDLEFRDVGGAEGLPAPDLAAALFDLTKPSLATALAHTDYGRVLRRGRRGVEGAVRKLKRLFD